MSRQVFKLVQLCDVRFNRQMNILTYLNINITISVMEIKIRWQELTHEVNIWMTVGYDMEDVFMHSA